MIGPRVLPGIYTVKMTRGTETYTTKLDVQLDPRATYTVADRKLELDAAMRVYALLGDLSFDVDRINGVHDALLERAGKLGRGRSAAQTMQRPGREGGRDSQEDRGYQGRRRNHRRRAHPRKDRAASTALWCSMKDARRITTWRESIRWRTNARTWWTNSKHWAAKDLKAVNASLAAKKLEAIQPITRDAWDKTNAESEGGSTAAEAGNFRVSDLLGSR